MITIYKNLREKIISTAVGVTVLFGLPMYGVVQMACIQPKHAKETSTTQPTNSPAIVSENNYSNTVFYGIRPVNIDAVRKDLGYKLKEEQ